ncbi:MAG: riboflavin synthase [Acidobacteria bacterium]|nr:riboflavin synthase [Acidobacteriota bacterium]
MFTGLIESVGRVEDVAPAASGVRLRVRTALGAEMQAGDSLAVNGVCVTVVAADAGAVHADVGPETARVTTLGSVRAGQPVNLERALRADGRVGGHFVQGHVDGTAMVKAIRGEADAHWLTIAFGDSLAAYFIPKGSVAVDGVSLTIAALREGEFDVMIVPFTWDHTNLHALHPGDRVNLECDMVGKYVARAAQIALAAR